MNDEMLIAFQRFLSDTCRISYNHYCHCLKTFSNKYLKAFIITIAILILLGLYVILRLQLNQKVSLNISASTDFQEPSFISLIT